MDLTGDDHLERAHTELGEPEALFRIGRARFFTKLSLGLLLLAYGVIANYFWWVHGPGNFGHLSFFFLILPPLSGLSLLFHMYRNRGLYVLIYPTGLLRLRHGDVVSFPWSEIEHVRLHLQRTEGPEFTRDAEGSVLACWIPVDVPTLKLGDAGVTVLRDDGVEAHFGPALSDYGELAEEVQRRIFVAMWPELLARFLKGDSIAFGELEVTSRGLRHAGKLIRWREVEELAIAQGKLSVKQTGKWLPWALVDVGSVPNPHLLFALAEEAHRMRASSRSEPKKGQSNSPQRRKDRTKSTKKAEEN